MFGEAQAANAGDVLDLWERVKMAEKGAADEAADGAGERREGLLDGVPTSFPALMQAQKISRKAAAAGFEWDSLDGVWEKVREEIAELQEAYAVAPKAANGKVDAAAASAGAAVDPAAAEAAVAAVEDELGDVLFSLVNVGRRMGVDVEGALRSRVEPSKTSPAKSAKPCGTRRRSASDRRVASCRPGRPHRFVRVSASTLWHI